MPAPSASPGFSPCAVLTTTSTSHVGTTLPYHLTEPDFCSPFHVDAIAPYLNWSVCEAALIIMTGSVPSLRPLLATILPNLFRSSYYTNISTLFASEKRATMMRPGGPPPSPGSPAYCRSESSSVVSPKDSGANIGMGAIVITKEYYIEASQRNHRPGTSWPSVRSMTPSTRFAPRAIVTCGKADDV